MVFSSLTFLTIFLPAVFVLQLIPSEIRAKNALLLAASLLFYAYGEPVYVLLMLLLSLANYLFALLIGTKAGTLAAKGFLASAVIVNLGLLAVFKYAGFLIQTVNQVLSLTLPVPAIALPVGISFYTFQALSYVIDVYRGGTKAQKSFPRLLLYISFFPQLIAGPIVKYHDVEKELENRSASTGDIACGIRRFAGGLCKKVLLANSLGACADALFARDILSLGAGAAWLGALSYLLQIYFDFSGYSDMAIGMGRMFGFHFRENFDLPYTSASITQFWRRWHMSLSGWFKEYVYIPLGGNRKGRARTILNKWLVFLLTGLWHGANLTFLFWGIYHGFFLMMEELFRGFSHKFRGKEAAHAGLLSALLPWVRQLAALIVVMVGFVFFRADSLQQQGFLWVRVMFTRFGVSPAGHAAVLSFLTPLYLTVLAAALVISGILFPGIARRARKVILTDGSAGAPPAEGKRRFLIDLLTLAGTVLCLLQLASGTYNPFIYFRF